MDAPPRLQRLTTPGGSLLMLPMDHGVSMGPAPGVAQPEATLDAVADAATCVTVHKGLVGRCLAYQDRLGILMHLSASSDVAPDPNDKRLVGTVQEAIDRGADGVSIHCNLGARTEPRMLEDFGRVSTDCHALGVPLVAMVYPRGPGIDDPFHPTLVAHAARLGMELGADAVKVPYTGSAKTFAPVVEGAGIPVIVAGGPRRTDFDTLLKDLEDARDVGAAGISIGRNVFQADDPATAMQAIARIFP